MNTDDALELFTKTLRRVKAGFAQAKSRALAALSRAQIAYEGLGPSTRFITLFLNGLKVDLVKTLVKTEQADDDSKKGYCGSQIDEAEGAFQNCFGLGEIN